MKTEIMNYVRLEKIHKGGEIIFPPL